MNHHNTKQKIRTCDGCNKDFDANTVEWINDLYLCKDCMQKWLAAEHVYGELLEDQARERAIDDKSDEMYANPK